MSEPFSFLMCRPDYFGVSYVINPWMTENVNKASADRAQTQWQRLMAEIASRARVELVEPRPGLPDMPFTANAGFVFGDIAVPSRFRCVERKGEEPYFDEWFATHDFSVAYMPEGVPFEGAGDALIDRGTPRVWAGWGHRSAEESHEALRRLLDIEVVSLRLVDDRFYHLDTCFCPLQGGFALYYPPAFDEDSNRIIERAIDAERRIAVSEADAIDFACNAVNIGDAVVLTRASAELKAGLSAFGLTTIEVDMTEFLKAGGAAKCLTLRIDEPGRNTDEARRSGERAAR